MRKLYLMKNFSTSIFDVIIITETWLSNDIFDSEILLYDFDIFRCDRLENSFGGVLIATRRELNGNLLLKSTLNSESLFIECKLNDLSLIFGAVYIPPTTPLSTYETFCDNLTSLKFSSLKYKMIIAGDFNQHP